MLSTWTSLNPFPNDRLFVSAKMKEFADNNFEFDENGSKFAEQIQNTVGKGEIAGHEQFLLFPQCFQKTYKELNFICLLTLSHSMTPFDAPEKQAFRKHCGKRRNCSSEQFLFFPQCFLPIWITFCHFHQI